MGKRRQAPARASVLTRRGLLSGAVAAGVASLVRPGAGLAAGLLGRQTVSGRSIGSLSGESAPILAPRQFALAGVQWSAPATAAIELRARAPGGRWSPWVSASTVGHDGDGRSAGGSRFGEPVWTGPASAVQLRTDRRLADVRVHFVTASASDWAIPAGALPRAAPVLEAGPGQPAIIARRGWAAGQAHPVHRPVYGTVKLAFVHHTVNPNGYSAGAVPALLRGIFDYHVQVRGFWDIAYNFLIDAYGRIWEGRAGGIDMAVRGAHAGAYNAESTGVAMLGDFMDVVPPPAAMQALESLLAWKLSLHGLPATGRVSVVVDPPDAYYTPFRPGAHVSLPRVAGHRDGDLTDCPGNSLYDRLPAVRPRVRALAGTPARLTAAPASVLIGAGAPVELSGTLGLLSGAPLAGEPLELQSLGPGGPAATTLATTVTGPDGSWSQSLGFQHNALVRALHRPRPASVADWVEVLVAPVITLAVQSVSPLTVSGTVAPSQRQVVIDLYRGTVPAGKPVRKRKTRAAGGTFTAQLRSPGPGNYVAVARTPAGLENAAGASPPIAVTVG